MTWRRSNPGSSRTFNAVTLLLIVVAAVGAIGVSPIALGLFHGATSRWERLSFIGQTYGAASAVISVLALVGVVATFAFQAKEIKRAREETRRQANVDLLEMAMHDPDLDECWGPLPSPSDARTRKQQLYVNMIVSEWSMSFEIGILPERRLRRISREMFQGTPGRDYWRRVRELRLSTSESRRRRRFHEILDEEYTRVLGELPERSVNSPGPGRSHGWQRPTFLGAIGAGLAFLALRRWRQRRSRR